MIGVLASIIGAIVLYNPYMLLSPAVFLLALKNRDLGLLAYFLYVLYVSQKSMALDVYSYGDVLVILVFSASSLLLLDDVLRRKLKVDRLELLASVFVMAGVLFPEAIVAGAVLHFLRLRVDWRALLPLALLPGTLLLFRGTLSDLGTAGQVVVFGTFTLVVLALAFLLWERKGVEMFGRQKY